MHTLPIVVKTVNSKVAEATKNDILQILEQYQIDINQLCVLITDSEPAIRSCGRLLAAANPNMVHVYCVPHEVHLVACQIRDLHPELNAFIGDLKKIFSRSVHRKNLFKMVTGVPLPPIPHHIRWGTWVTSVNYLYHYLDAVVWWVDLTWSNRFS